MANEEAVKTGLVLVHGLAEKAQLQAELCLELIGEAREKSPSQEQFDIMFSNMTSALEGAFEKASKAGVLASSLVALLEDRKEKNAVIGNALNALSVSYALLERAKEELGKLQEGR